jgi:hypothetical protein
MDVMTDGLMAAKESKGWAEWGQRLSLLVIHGCAPDLQVRWSAAEALRVLD